MARATHIFTVFVCLQLSSACYRAPVGSVVTKVTSGAPLIDLRAEDFADGRIVRIPTRWEFYWGRFLLPEDFRGALKPARDAGYAGMRPWTASSVSGQTFPGQGFATYRMLLRLPPDARYGFRIQQQLMAYRLYVDGELLIEAGRVGRSHAETLPERRQRNFYIAAGSDAKPIELLLHVSNHHMFRGGLRGVLVVGEAAALDLYAHRKVALDLALIGFLAAVALYHLAFFFMQSREWSFLLFALLCLSFAFRIPFMSEKVVELVAPGTPWYWHLRVLGSMNIFAPAILILY